MKADSPLIRILDETILSRTLKFVLGNKATYRENAETYGYLRQADKNGAQIQVELGRGHYLVRSSKKAG